MFRAPFGLGGFPAGITADGVSVLTQNPGAIRLPASPVCENGRPYVTDPCTGQAVCFCQLSGDPTPHSTVSGGPDNVRNMQHPSGLPMGTEPSAFKSPLNCGISGIRADRPESWKALPSNMAPHPYDPSLAFHPYNTFYAGLDLNSAARRKAATRETTSPLKAWLSEHRKNPYPTKAEKIMLAIITKMTLTQVSTWFANARRRLKKENKLCWDSADDKDDDDEDDIKNIDDESRRAFDSDREIDVEGLEKRLSGDEDSDNQLDLSDISDTENEPTDSKNFKLQSRLLPSSQLRIPDNILVNKPVNTSNNNNNGVSKPKIWSISQIIDVDTPKPVPHQPVFTHYNGLHHTGSRFPSFVDPYGAARFQMQMPGYNQEKLPSRPTLDTPPDTPPFSTTTKETISPIKFNPKSPEHEEALNLKTERLETQHTSDSENDES